MSPPPEDKAGRDPGAGQWPRTALAMALVFGSLPVASRLFLGNWGFQDAAGIACLCLLAAAYLHIRGRARRPIPDDAASMEMALQLAVDGRYDDAITVLTAVVALSPRFWQAFQLRGELHLRRPGAAEAALGDFTEAIRLAPDEPHLYLLRAHAHALLGDEPAAQQDYALAAGRSGAAGPAVGIYLVEGL